jgi:hypothetical protein
MTAPRRRLKGISRELTDNAGPHANEHWFDPYWRSERAKLASFIAGKLALVEAYLGRDRKRILKAADRARLASMVEALICHLWRESCCDAVRVKMLGGIRPASLIVSRAKPYRHRPERYRSPLETEKLLVVIEAMQQLGLVNHKKAKQGRGEGPASTVAATGKLLEDLRNLGMRGDGLVWRGLNQEVIVLKKGPKGAKVWIKYDDTDLSRQLRRDVQRINAGLWMIELQLEPTDGRLYDLNNRLMRRQFSNGSFFHDGRLFSALQNLPGNQRSGLRLQGQPVAVVDFVGMNVQLLYAKEGEDPPAGDLYAFRGFDGHRAFAKIFFNALLFSRGPLRAFPDGEDAPRPKGLKLRDAIQAVKELHPAVAGRFGTGIGHKLAYLESNILIRALLECKGMGLAAYPLHDALLVPAHKASAAQAILQKAFQKEFGRNLSVLVEVSKPPSVELVRISQFVLALSRSQPGLKARLGHVLLSEADIPEIAQPGSPRDVVFEALKASKAT